MDFYRRVLLSLTVSDVNECTKQDVCGAGGQCVNMPGSYKCECHKGFRSRAHRPPACEGEALPFSVGVDEIDVCVCVCVRVLKRVDIVCLVTVPIIFRHVILSVGHSSFPLRY